MTSWLNSSAENVSCNVAPFFYNHSVVDINTHYIHSVVVQVMQLVHATDKTWYTVLYHHTMSMYVISVSNISIKTNFKQIARVELKCIQYSEGDYILCMTSRYFSVHSPTSGYCVLFHIPMVWRNVKVVRQGTSHTTSRHSFITTVWWYNILYQTSDFH